MNKYFLCLTCSVVALTSSHLAVASPLDNSHIHTQHTLGLKPISSLEASYNLATAVFLPDFEDGLDFSSHKNNENISTRENCSGYPLSSCPTHAKCSKCTFDTKYKITSCDTDYKQSGNTCIAKTCSEINGGYKADVPTNQICTITNTSVRTCYSSCRAVNTSGYPLDTCPSGAKCTTAPDCVTSATTKGNCSPVKQKVTGCTSSTQKVNSAATACIDKDDTCPSNYFKSCETGIQGAPKYTERGSACYQCKPKTPPTQIGSILYGDGTIDSSLINGKTPIGIVFDSENTLAVSLLEICDKWSDTTKDISALENCSYQDYDAGTGTACFIGGKENTKIIIETMGTPGMIPTKAFKFGPNGCSSDFCKIKNWFVPSIKELQTLCQAKTAVIKGLELTKSYGAKTTFPGQENWYWSSTESKDGTGQWAMRMDGCYVNIGYSKTNSGCFRPVINYKNI